MNQRHKYIFCKLTNIRREFHSIFFKWNHRFSGSFLMMIVPLMAIFLGCYLMLELSFFVNRRNYTYGQAIQRIILSKSVLFYFSDKHQHIQKVPSCSQWSIHDNRPILESNRVTLWVVYCLDSNALDMTFEWK